MNTFLSILETLILVSVILFILGENKRPVHTLAWLLVVILFPIVGIILYYFFGREHKKRRLISASRLDIYKERTLDSVGNFVQEPRDKYSDLASLCESTNRAICLTGNGLKLYTEFYA
ncbi:MAG: PLDc N-terminal domain-containing protein, partial [Bacteroidales bacterium]|nr:PLDc N-terminal domain-containing protein [Bacteroidales bacterium]